MDFKPKAILAHEQTLLTSRQNGDQKGEALALMEIGKIWLELKRAHKALEFFEPALVICKALGDQLLEAQSINYIGGIWRQIGDQQKAMTYYQQALTMSQTQGERNGELAILNNIAEIYFSNGEIQKALAILKESTTILQEIGDIVLQVVNHANIAFTYEKLGDIDHAVTEMTTAIDLMKKHSLQRDNSNMSLGEYEAILKEWKVKIDRSNDVVKQAQENVIKIYNLMGEKGLRETLKNKGYPDKVIEDLVAWVKRITG